ncbi:MAG TPA: hypothetical protein VG842_06705 [Sediminibacterium sp.]|nr:hypothetical protein [Sediminibacterium sp.]
MRKPIFYIILLLCLPAAVSAQEAASPAITRQLQQYTIDHLQEKLFVHTNKTVFVAGEQLWCKLYTTDAQQHHPLGLSKVAYIEILDPSGHPVIQDKLALSAGCGSGVIDLPASLTTGVYTLRAYTQWMRNAGENGFFEQPLTVFNTIHNPEPQQETMSQDHTFDLQFFPEGGQWVDGIESRIGFKATDIFGSGIACSGAILNRRNDTLARFTSLQYGMGSFRFLPQKQETYRAVVRIGDTILTRSLPEIQSTGFVLGAAYNSDTVAVFYKGTDLSDSVYLLVHQNGGQISLLRSKLQEGKTAFIINRQRLPEGLSHLVLFNSKGKPVAERLFFRQPAIPPVLTIHTDRQDYAPRNAVEVQILAGTQSPDLSASVFLLDALESQPASENIVQYLFLGSDLKGKVEDPAYYFRQHPDETQFAAAVDNLMLTQGWSRFSWSEVQAHTPNHYLPEAEGPLVQGVLSRISNGKPVSGIRSYLSVPAVYFRMNSTISREDGLLYFNPGNFYGTKEIVVQTNPYTDSGYRISITAPFAPAPTGLQKPTPVFRSALAPDLLKRSVAMQANNLYAPPEKFLPLPGVDTLPFFGLADKRYYLDDYTRFTSMEEVMKEYVTDLRLRGKENDFSIRAYNRLYDRFFEEEPLILLDGVPQFNVNKLMQLDPLKIKSLSVVTGLNYQGSSVNKGVVSFSTYNGDLAGLPIDARALVLEYQGLQWSRQFYSPVYKTDKQKTSHLPDMRTSLYWQPDIRFQDGRAVLRFYTGDIKGRFAIVIQGLGTDGIPVYSQQTIEVR